MNTSRIRCSKTASCSILREEDLKRIKRKRKGEGSRRKSTPQLEHPSLKILSPAPSADMLGAQKYMNHFMCVQSGNLIVEHQRILGIKSSFCWVLIWLRPISTISVPFTFLNQLRLLTVLFDITRFLCSLGRKAQ